MTALAAYIACAVALGALIVAVETATRRLERRDERRRRANSRVIAELQRHSDPLHRLRSSDGAEE